MNPAETAAARWVIMKWKSLKSGEDTTSPTSDGILLAQVRESFGRVVYSHKVHEKQADIELCNHRKMQAALVILTGISSGTFLTTLTGITGSSTITNLTTSFAALLVSWISLATRTFNFAERANAHRSTASRLWDIRESYISLIADLMLKEVSGAEARNRRNSLQAETQDVYKDAPRTSVKAFKRAQIALKQDEEMTFFPTEIDALLPEALRLNKLEDTNDDQ